MQTSLRTSDGAEIVYTVEGEGPALVLLHGWSQSAAMFRHQIEAFSRTHRVLAPDFRGHGASPRAAGGYRIHRFAADLAELLAKENIETATFVGWSMGASVLWAYLDLFGTGRAERLVFVDEPASVMRQADMDDEAAADAGALFDAGTMVAIAADIAGPNGHASRGAFLDSMITKGIPDDLKAFLLAENLKVDPADVAALFVNHCSIDWRDVFRIVDRPTLIVGGRVSHVSVRSQEWIHSKVHGSRLLVFEEAEGGAHFPFLEAPDSFNAALGAFLSETA